MSLCGIINSRAEVIPATESGEILEYTWEETGVYL
jgi:hypothetical protein